MPNKSRLEFDPEGRGTATVLANQLNNRQHSELRLPACFAASGLANASPQGHSSARLDAVRSSHVGDTWS